MRELTVGEKQDTDYDCGAACCLYIMKMLDVAEGGDTKKSVMKTVRTLWNIDVWGSTPRNVGLLIRERCKKHNKLVTVKQGAGDSNKHGRFYLHFLRPGRAIGFKVSTLTPANDPNWSRGPASNAPPDLAILRGLVKAETNRDNWGEAHWVVQTNFRGRVQVMDPTNGVVQSTNSFAEWMTGVRVPDTLKSDIWHSMGLDLEIQG